MCVLMLKELKSLDDSMWTGAEKLSYMELSAWRVVGKFFVFCFTIELVWYFDFLFMDLVM